MGKAFKKDAKLITDHLMSLEPEQVKQLENSLEQTGYFLYSINL